MSALTANKKEIDFQKAQQFAGQFVQDLAANYSGVLNLIGLELGLYKAMQNSGALTPLQLAKKTGTHERYIREWLNNQAAGGYVTYNPANKTYTLPEEHALVLTETESPLLLGPAYYVVNSLWSDKDKLIEAFKTGKGIGWHDHHHHLFFGVETVYRSGYLANLNSAWIPSVEGLEEKLRSGGRVADVGCGHGASTILMAEEFPDSFFYGFDYHHESIEVAKRRARQKSLDNIIFSPTDADEYAEGNFDLICFFDCLHDLGDPLAALKYSLTKLAPGGNLLVVEPSAGDRVEDNLNPIGRMFYAASTAICVPHARSEEGGHALGAQAGPAAIERLVREAGFSQFRIAQQTPVNLIYQISK